MSPIVIILVILAVFFLFSGYGFHSGYWGGTPNYQYGYGSGGLGLIIIIIVVILLLTGRL